MEGGVGSGGGGNFTISTYVRREEGKAAQFVQQSGIESRMRLVTGKGALRLPGGKEKERIGYPMRCGEGPKFVKKVWQGGEKSIFVKRGERMVRKETQDAEGADARRVATKLATSYSKGNGVQGGGEGLWHFPLRKEGEQLDRAGSLSKRGLASLRNCPQTAKKEKSYEKNRGISAG